jgi:hypothetical protein
MTFVLSFSFFSFSISTLCCEGIVVLKKSIQTGVFVYFFPFNPYGD